MFEPDLITDGELHHCADGIPERVFVDVEFGGVMACRCAEFGILHAQLRTTAELPHGYRLAEEDHHFHLEDDGKYYRLSRIYRETIDKATGNLLARELIRDNHSEVMYDYCLIPPKQIR